jgi:hypothetical protein
VCALMCAYVFHANTSVCVCHSSFYLLLCHAAEKIRMAERLQGD